MQQGDPAVKANNTRNFVIKMTFLLGVFTFCTLAFVPEVRARLTGSLSVEAITERLQPMGKVNIAGAPAAGTQSAAKAGGNGSPQDIYEHNCKMCHQTGLAGAPKFGNKADWAPRISQGFDTLFKAAWDGVRAMPPKGNCLNCSEAEIKATIEYMIDASK